MTESLDQILLVGAAVLLVAIAGVRLSATTRLPTLLLYLGLGLLLGAGVAGLDFDNAQLAHDLGYAALIIILTEGGLTARWPRIRPTVPAAAVLATVGVAVSVGITAAAARWVLDLEWRQALLVGAVVGSTDAAAVFSLLRQVPLPTRLSGVLEAESGFNDAPVVLLVVALTASGTGSLWSIAGLVVVELAVGAGVGLLVGRAGVQAVRRIALPAAGLYPLAVTALTVLAYGVAALVGGSGFLAVYVTALVLGNSRLPHRIATVSFIEGAAWLAQIGLFVMLGLLATPSRLAGAVVPALIIGSVLLLVARPVSVVVSTSPFGFRWREQAFLSWAGLRGAVPIVLATVPMVAHDPGGQQLFDLVFVLVVVFTLVQGPSLPWVARRLQVAEAEATEELEVDALPLERIGADILYFTVPPGSRLVGVEVFELRLPAGAVVSLIVREQRPIVPGPRTLLEPADQLLVVVPSGLREQVEARLQAVSRGGRLAGWLAGVARPRRRPGPPPPLTGSGRPGS